MEKWAQDKVALVTVVFDHAELGQHSRTAGYYTTGADQLVKMKLPTNRTEYTTRRRINSGLQHIALKRVLNQAMPLLFCLTLFDYRKDQTNKQTNK